ncbi:reverse transcriptase domain-containing protein [Tanacetum coccineum]
MRTRSQARKRQQQQVRQTSVESPNLEKPNNNQETFNPPIVTMDDNQTMAQLLEAPTEGYEDAIVVPKITANNFEIKHGLLNLVQNKQFFGHDKEDPHAHIRYFNKITSTMKFPNVPSTSVKLMLFPFSLEGAARIWLEKEPPRSILTWDDLVSKFINKFFPPSKTTNLRNEITRFQQKFDETFYEAWRFNDLLRGCPHHGFSELHQLDTFYNALNSNDQDSLNSAAGGNFLDKMPRECLKIIESKSKVIILEARQSFLYFVYANTALTSGLGKTLTGNTITNPKEDLKGITTRSGVAYQGPAIPSTSSSSPKVMNRDTEVTKDTMLPTNNGSTEDVQPPVIQVQSQNPTSEPVVDPVSAPMPNQRTSIPFPSRRNDERRREKANDQIEKFYEIFRDLSFEISFTDALTLMPKFGSMERITKKRTKNKDKTTKLDSEWKRLRRQPQVRPKLLLKSSNLEKTDKSSIVAMADNSYYGTIARQPTTDGYEDAIVIPEITRIHLRSSLVSNLNGYHDNIQEYVVPAAAAISTLLNSGYHLQWSQNQFRPSGIPPVRNPHANNQNNFNRGNNFNQNRGNNFNQGQIYRPPVHQPVVNQPVAHQGPAPQTHGVSKTDFERYVTANDAVLRNMQNQGQNLQSQMANLTDMLSKFVTAIKFTSVLDASMNTVTNPKEDLKGITTRSGVTIQGPKAVIITRNPNPEPNVAPVVTPVPKASIPFPSRRNDERRKEMLNDQ